MVCDDQTTCIHNAVLIPVLYYESIITGSDDTTPREFIALMQSVTGMSDEVANHLMWYQLYTVS